MAYKLRSTLILPLLSLLTIAGTAQADGPALTYVRLRVPGSIYTAATGINNAGVVVGHYMDAATLTYRGFKYDGSFTTIDYPGSAATFVDGIGPTGTIVGSWLEAGNQYHSFVLDNGNFSSFDFPDNETDAQSINSQGQMVGVYDQFLGAPVHGYLKDGETFTTIDMPGAGNTGAYGINDSGVISGTYTLPGSEAPHGFAIVGGQFIKIEFPGTTETFVGGLNNLGTVVGWATHAGGSHGFRRTNLSYRTFRTELPGATRTKGRAINDNGHIVGTYYSSDCPSGCGYVAMPRAGANTCDQDFRMEYANGTLTLRYGLTTSTTLTLSTWLNIRGTWYRLFSKLLPALPSTTNLSLPASGAAGLGSVTGLSMLTTGDGVTLCADLAQINTGTVP